MNLIIIPTGRSEKWGGALDLDLPIRLDFPYNDDDLENEIYYAFEQCFSLIPDENAKETVLEKALNIKGYSKAARDRRFISAFWNVDEGYIVTPTQKVPRQGYCHLTEKAFELGSNPKKREIATAIRAAISISTY
jgi:hypothetical protein